MLSVGQSVGVTEPSTPTEDIIETAKIDQSWRTFAPDPVDSELWFTTSGNLINNTKIDIYRGGSVTFDRPRTLDEKYNTVRWGSYLGRVKVADYLVGDTDHHELFANYLCTEWNQNHEIKVTQVEIYAVEKPAVGKNRSKLSKKSLITHTCSQT